MSTMSFWDWLLQPVMAQLAVIDKKLDQLIKQGVKEMAELDDLKAAVSNMVATQQQGFADIDAAIAKIVANVQSGVDPAQVEQQAQAISSATASMKDELTKLEAALNPPAPPQP